MSRDLDDPGITERASFQARQTLVVRERSSEPGGTPEVLIAPGTVLGSYRVVSEIGSGSVGRVYLAEHALLGRKVALKMLKREYSNDPKLVRRFFAEAKTVNEIAHPNIVAITDFVISEEHPSFYIMELLEGCTLDQLLKEQRAIDVRMTIAIASQLCAALQAAHDKGVVHRDLKPENVFLVPAEGRYDVRLLDFGVAKFVRSQTGIHTAVGSLNGTPRYMSPEATLGLEVDHHADLYALGMVLYEMLAGFHPFEGSAFAEILVAHRSREVVPLREAATQPIPEELAAIVHACLEKRPESRPSSAGEIRRRLSRLIAAPRPSRWPLIAVLVALLLSMAAVAALAIGEEEAQILIVPEPVAPIVEAEPVAPPERQDVAPPPVAPPVEVAPAKAAPKPKLIRQKKRNKRKTAPRPLPPREVDAPLPDGAEVRNPYD